ncbi:uncharacterized protein LOC110695636 [Chenopodium quinoa]|uniref:uncharacterized protein LOC110695636 n=1 Tax=Chenopodium quinoa TaxID=63459 RepID=UPI000B7767E5|nr:uncharacterized protein LOC110695636 [Chenopodium quinoa]XP_021728539.1 uncharacterized protein LOC110695636 [Chenopodium quinoa]
MLEGSVDLEDQSQQNRIGPDLFGFYMCEIADLLTQVDNFMPYSPRTKGATKVSSDVLESSKGTDTFSHASSLFSNSLENVIPDVKREMLKSSLRQSISTLTQEVDEVFDPVMRIRHVISCLNYKRREISSGKAPIVGNSTTLHCKKLKTSSSNAKERLLIDESRDSEKETDASVDLKVLLDSDPILVEETMIKQSDELLVMLNHMEKQLEDLLYTIVSKCRPMAQQEKQHLQKLIEKLPAKNLDRILEIINYKKSSDTVSLDKIFIDLEEQENVTLWRLYFYVKAVENARKLSA